FKFVNRDGEGENIELKDWSYWKGEINQGIPVFYRENEIKGQKGIIDFGLPFMYKQPAKYRVKDLLPNYSDKKDLAEAILGNAKKDSSLKARIFFRNAKCRDKRPKVLDKVVVTLSSPKSSFTPNYIKQGKGKNGKTHVFNTYNTGGQLKGFKKYPVKSETIEHRGESEKMQTHFKPLANG